MLNRHKRSKSDGSRGTFYWQILTFLQVSLRGQVDLFYGRIKSYQVLFQKMLSLLYTTAIKS